LVPQGDAGKSLARTTNAASVYVDDSRIASNMPPVVSRLQAFYGRVADFTSSMWIPSRKLTYTPNEPGYYYEGVVLVFNKSGEVVLNKGQVSR